MTNPVYKAIKTNRPFIYYHTHVINEAVLKEALTDKKSLEVDISVAEDGSIFIGHPLIFYEFRRQSPPNNLPLSDVLEQAKRAALYLVLDCKDVRAITKAKEIIKEFGVGNCLFHSWVDILCFKPYPPEIAVEPHWFYEDLPFDQVKKLHVETKVPLILSARGLTQERLRNDREIVNRVIKVSRGMAEAINFNLPNGEAPPKEIMQKLLDEGILTWLNVDRVPARERPPVFIGMSDNMDLVSHPQDFK
jgi:hypothetical protein